MVGDNANCQGAMVRGSIRKGEALLAGLLRCGHCGRKLHVGYSGTQGNIVRYQCRGAHINHGNELCISFGGLRVDRAVGEVVLHVLKPLGIEAALKAIEDRQRASCEVLRQAELALEAARFEEKRARRQYDAVDPDNRLVAGELERRWNERLAVVREREQHVSALLASQEREALAPDEREEYLALGADLERAWNHERATPESRKRIVRALLVEIVANVEGDRIRLRLHWQGGDHTELTVRKNRPGHHRWTADAETADLVRELARLMPDGSIAGLLMAQCLRRDPDVGSRRDTFQQLGTCDALHSVADSQAHSQRSATTSHQEFTAEQPVPAPRRECGEAPLDPDPSRDAVAEDGVGAGRVGGDPEERELSAGAVSTPQRPMRPEEGHCSGRSLHADRRLGECAELGCQLVGFRS